MPTYADGVLQTGTIGAGGITTASFAAGAIDAAAIAASAIGASELAADAAVEIAAAVWDRAMTNHTTPGTYGADVARRAVKTLTFDGVAGTGAVGNVPLFTTTGNPLIIAIRPLCTTDLVSAGAGTLALGVTANTALFIAATVATLIDAGEIWTETTAPAANGVALPAALKDIAIADNDEIIGTVAVGDITAGVIEFVVYWLPMSSGDLVAAA